MMYFIKNRNKIWVKLYINLLQSMTGKNNRIEYLKLNYLDKN